MSDERRAWPNLPTKDFVAGRTATTNDVDQGNAVFSMDGQGTAADITVPQYVFWTDQDGKKMPMILVQAERAPNNLTIVGLRDFAGNDTAATLPEVELLGTGRPN